VHTISFTASSAHLREGEEQDNWRSGAAGSVVGGISCRFPILMAPSNTTSKEGADGGQTDDGAPSSFILSSLSATGGAWCHPGPPKVAHAGRRQEEKKSYLDCVGWERRQSAGWGGRAVPMERPGRSVLARSGGGLRVGGAQEI
jgi:hypothetical protein